VFHMSNLPLRVKARWDDEEVYAMAVREEQLIRDGVRFVNQALLQFVPGRSLEAIRGKRRQAAYKALVETRLTEQAQGNNMQDGLPPTSCVPPRDVDIPGDETTSLRREARVLVLPHCEEVGQADSNQESDGDKWQDDI